MDECNIVLLVVLLVLVYCYKKSDRSAFTNKPSELDKQNYANQILSHKQVFSSDFYAAREIMQWIDAITYEDVRSLIIRNNFNKKSVLSVLN
jgi:hypothetical protein